MLDILVGQAANICLITGAFVVGLFASKNASDRNSASQRADAAAADIAVRGDLHEDAGHGGSVTSSAATHWPVVMPVEEASEAGGGEPARLQQDKKSA